MVAASRRSRIRRARHTCRGADGRRAASFAATGGGNPGVPRTFAPDGHRRPRGVIAPQGRRPGAAEHRPAAHDELLRVGVRQAARAPANSSATSSGRNDSRITPRRCARGGPAGTVPARAPAPGRARSAGASTMPGISDAGARPAARPPSSAIARRTESTMNRPRPASVNPIHPSEFESRVSAEGGWAATRRRA